jgi:hypothetical protein
MFSKPSWSIPSSRQKSEQSYQLGLVDFPLASVTVDCSTSFTTSLPGLSSSHSYRRRRQSAETVFQRIKKYVRTSIRTGLPHECSRAEPTVADEPQPKLRARNQNIATGGCRLIKNEVRFFRSRRWRNASRETNSRPDRVSSSSEIWQG